MPSLDLPWTPHVHEVKTASDLQELIWANKSSLLYVYSPLCGYSVRGAPEFDAASTGIPRVYRFNAVPTEDPAIRRQVADRFSTAFGFPIKYYPMILGISKNGRYVEYTGPITSETLRRFKKALDKT